MMRPLIFTMALVLLCCATADAATVGLEFEPGSRGGSARLTFLAAAGEANAVLATAEAGRAWVIRDDGAPLTAGAGCTALDAHSARCSPPLYSTFVAAISTLDGNDVVRTPGSETAVRVDAGDGDDIVAGGGTLAGGPGRDRLTGGPGRDGLYGGDGADELRGGDGDDLLAGGQGDDVLDGARGADVAFYGTRKAAVVADLAKGVAGSHTERDVLRAVEGVEGGAGDDTLAGDGGSNRLTGGDGADTLAGRGGDDTLLDGRGIDQLIGGDGDDVLSASDPGDRLIGGRGADQLAAMTGARLDSGDGADRLSFDSTPQVLRCGPATDTVQSAHLSGLRLDGCERADIPLQGTLTLAVTPSRRADGALALGVAYRAVGVANRSFGMVEVLLHRAGRRLRLGRTAFRVVTGTRTEVLIRPTPAARRALRRVANPLVEVRVNAGALIDPAHVSALPLFGKPTATGRWRIRL